MRETDRFRDTGPGRFDVVRLQPPLHRIHQHQKKDHPGDHLHVAEGSGVVSEFKRSVSAPGIQVKGEIPIGNLGEGVDAPHSADLVDQIVIDRPAVPIVPPGGRDEIKEHRFLDLPDHSNQPFHVSQLEVPGIDMDVESTGAVYLSSQSIHHAAEGCKLLKSLRTEELGCYQLEWVGSLNGAIGDDLEAALGLMVVILDFSQKARLRQPFSQASRLNVESLKFDTKGINRKDRKTSLMFQEIFQLQIRHPLFLEKVLDDEIRLLRRKPWMRRDPQVSHEGDLPGSRRFERPKLPFVINRGLNLRHIGQEMLAGWSHKMGRKNRFFEPTIEEECKTGTSERPVLKKKKMIGSIVVLRFNRGELLVNRFLWSPPALFQDNEGGGNFLCRRMTAR